VLENACFVCGFTREYYDDIPNFNGPSFDSHKDKDHNYWFYVYFYVYLKQKKKVGVVVKKPKFKSIKKGKNENFLEQGSFVCLTFYVLALVWLSFHN